MKPEARRYEMFVLLEMDGKKKWNISKNPIRNIKVCVLKENYFELLSDINGGRFFFNYFKVFGFSSTTHWLFSFWKIFLDSCPFFLFFNLSIRVILWDFVTRSNLLAFLLADANTNGATKGKTSCTYFNAI